MKRAAKSKRDLGLGPESTLLIRDCLGQPNICGSEAACKATEDGGSQCVCPHDKSLPTHELRCPNRSIVPLTPKPIHNIIPPSGNSTGNATTPLSSAAPRPQLDQAQHQHHHHQPVVVEPHHEPLRPFPAIQAGLALSGCLLILGLGVIWWRRRAGAKGDKCAANGDLEGSPMSLKSGLLTANKYMPNPQYFSCASPEVPLLARDSLTFLSDLGEGCFGRVYKGEWRPDPAAAAIEPGNDGDEAGAVIVAVKVLKESASCEAEEDFMREVEIMSTFRHENILALLGVVLRDADNGPWMVFEFMAFGDLAELLRKNSPGLRAVARNPNLPPLSQNSLHRITVQIAEGMTYLAAQRFVHRDLACRNCLVGDNLVVKIADFGMSRDVYTCDYYKIGGSRMLPVRWMSPESVMYGRFTLESDVWSFAVVLWEVYSFGKQPYFGHSNEEVVRLILQGIMLIPPEDCPSHICQLMRDCWRTEPKDRLRFPEILERLKSAQLQVDSSSTTTRSSESLPRPPQGPVTVRTPGALALDPEGYLLPSPAILREYLQPLPMCANA